MVRKIFLCIFIFCKVWGDEMLDSDDVKKIYEIQELVKKKSGQYITFGLGTSALRAKNVVNKKEDYIPIMFSIKTGSQTFFTKNVGVRGFFGLDMYSENFNFIFKQPPYKSFFTFFSLGIDLLTEFALTKNNQNFLGTFFGIGAGASFYIDNVSFDHFKDSLIAGFVVEAGIDLTIALQHRISFGVKVTPIQRRWSQVVAQQTDFLPFINYQYTFSRDLFKKKIQTNQ